MISFSQEIKNELCTIELTQINNVKAELSAIVLLCSELTNIQRTKYLKITLTNSNVVRRVFKLFKQLDPSINIEIIVKNKSDLNKTSDILIENNDHKVEELLDIDVFFPDEFPQYLNTPEAKLSFVRGVFLARGSISNPQKGYNINISAYDNEFCDQFIMLCHEFEIVLKKISRNRSYLIYTKGGEQIGNFLRCIGSINMMYEFENIRIIRDAKNYATRMSNFDNANITKTIKSSQEIIETIKSLEQMKLLDDLKPRDLCAIQIRVNYPEYSLIQICEDVEAQGFKMSKSTLSTLFTKLKKRLKDNIS